MGWHPPGQHRQPPRMGWHPPGQQQPPPPPPAPLPPPRPRPRPQLRATLRQARHWCTPCTVGHSTARRRKPSLPGPSQVRMRRSATRAQGAWPPKRSHRADSRRGGAVAPQPAAQLPRQGHARAALEASACLLQRPPASTAPPPRPARRPAKGARAGRRGRRRTCPRAATRGPPAAPPSAPSSPSSQASATTSASSSSTSCTADYATGIGGHGRPPSSTS